MVKKGEIEVLSVMFLAAAILSLAAIGIISAKIVPFFGESTQKSGDQMFFNQKIVRNAETVCSTPGISSLPGEGGYEKSFQDLERGYLCGDGSAICLEYGSGSATYQFEGKCSSYELNVEGDEEFSSGTYSFSMDLDGEKLVINVAEVDN